MFGTDPNKDVYFLKIGYLKQISERFIVSHFYTFSLFSCTVNLENLDGIKSRPPRPGLILDQLKSRTHGFPAS